MSIRLSTTLLPLGAVAAAVVAFVVTDRAPPAAASAPADVPAVATASGAGVHGALPPNHPPVPGMSSPHGTGMPPIPNGDNLQPPSLTWTAPKGWEAQANQNPMRLATYKVGDGAELSIVRAGGTTDANVKRWTGQFDGAPKVTRTDRQVHGLGATVVRIDGSFLGGGMGAPTEKHDGWSMLAAIVESSGSPYFFKLLGPSAQIDRARASFDSLVNSVTPRTAD